MAVDRRFIRVSWFLREIMAKYHQGNWKPRNGIAIAMQYQPKNPSLGSIRLSTVQSLHATFTTAVSHNSEENLNWKIDNMMKSQIVLFSSFLWRWVVLLFTAFIWNIIQYIQTMFSFFLCRRRLGSVRSFGNRNLFIDATNLHKMTAARFYGRHERQRRILINFYSDQFG